MERVSDAVVFCTVVRKGSFTAAAEALALSKSAVSKYINRLESHLGARLINRTTRRLSTTEVGEAFYIRASVAIAELEEAEAEVRDISGRPFGHLRVSAPTFYGAEILSRQLIGFHRAYPDISVDLVLENRFVDLVEERFDLAVRLSAPKISSLVMRKLTDIPIILSASPGYIDQYGRPETPQDLREHECLLYSVRTGPNEWTFTRKDGGRYRVPVSGKFQFNDDHVSRQAAIDGLGIVQMPKLFLEDALKRGDLLQLFPDDAMPAVTLALVYPSRQGLPRKVRAFIDFLSEARSSGERPP